MGSGKLGSYWETEKMMKDYIPPCSVPWPEMGPETMRTWDKFEPELFKHSLLHNKIVQLKAELSLTHIHNTQARQARDTL